MSHRQIAKPEVNAAELFDAICDLQASSDGGISFGSSSSSSSSSGSLASECQKGLWVLSRLPTELVLVVVEGVTSSAPSNAFLGHGRLWGRLRAIAATAYEIGVAGRYEREPGDLVRFCDFGSRYPSGLCVCLCARMCLCVCVAPFASLFLPSVMLVVVFQSSVVNNSNSLHDTPQASGGGSFL